MVSKTIKALSLWQPWASLIAMGEKHYETRSWATDYRGPLAIHAAKRWTLAEVQAFSNFNKWFVGLAEKWDYTNDQMHPLPLGAVVCVAKLVDVVPTHSLVQISFREYAFGNYAPGRFAWKLELVNVFEQPVAAKGSQGLWTWKWEGGAG